MGKPERRYLLNFSSQNLKCEEFDFLVVGSGVAGIRSAITLSEFGSVAVLTKDRMQECNSYLAQGGIAAAIGEDDNIRYHVDDTLYTGQGLCSEKAVSILVEEGPRQIEEFLKFGANFDKTKDSRIALTREAAHSKNRIIHARGDAIGIELELTLISRSRQIDRIHFMEGVYLVDVITEDGRAVGAIVYDEKTIKFRIIYFKAIILATGGIGYLYRYTTNSHIATGDGVAIARRAGAEITDMEFIQFHPTTLFLEGAPRFLISEAVRGEGAILVNSQGERFMKGIHELAELAPRDVVSRAILEQIEKTGHPCVYLDLTHMEPDFVRNRFPNIYSNCLRYGVDISCVPIPVKPSAHFMVGGVKSDMNGATNVEGLFVCGETACTFVHGANRLASNSLLECVVFGNRAGMAAAAYAAAKCPGGGSGKKRAAHSYDYKFFREPKGFSLKLQGDRVISDIRAAAWDNLSIVRTSEGFEAMDRFLEKYDFIRRLELPTRRSLSIVNMLEVLGVINRFAKKRTESRGTHYRLDFPLRDDAVWKKHLVERGSDEYFCEV